MKKSIPKDPTILLALDTIAKNKQAIFFVNTKRSAEKLAEDIAHAMSESPCLELSESILHDLSRPTQQCIRLSNCIKKAIAFHHAGLTANQKEHIEEAFRKSQLKIICATTTLAFGLDLPAWRSVIVDVRRFGRRGMDWIPTLEYLQMAGRAGRPGKEDEGQAVCIAGTSMERQEIESRYIFGEPEEIFSGLGAEPALRTYLLSLIASHFVRTKEQLMSFFAETFWAHQFKNMVELERTIDKMLRLLTEFEFISAPNTGDFVSAAELGNQHFAPTSLGKRVSELYIDPLTAHHFCICLKRASSKRLTALSFLQMVSHTLEMRPLLRVKSKEHELISDILLSRGNELLDLEPTLYDPEYEDFLHSTKTSLFFVDWIEEYDEEALLEKWGIKPGEVRAKLSSCDWLLYTAHELARILALQPLLSPIARVRVRVKYGAKEELLPLLQLRDIGRIRARKLYNNKIQTVGDVRQADLGILSTLIGKATAESIKNQVSGKSANQKPAHMGLSEFENQ